MKRRLSKKQKRNRARIRRAKRKNEKKWPFVVTDSDSNVVARCASAVTGFYLAWEVGGSFRHYENIGVRTPGSGTIPLGGSFPVASPGLFNQYVRSKKQ